MGLDFTLKMTRINGESCKCESGNKTKWAKSSLMSFTAVKH